jgi:hypothetical protein
VSIWGPTASPADSKFPPLSQYFVDRLRDCYGDAAHDSKDGGSAPRAVVARCRLSSSESGTSTSASASSSELDTSTGSDDASLSECAAGPVVEPPSSYLLQHKGVLALLSEMLPGHPNLLHTTLDDPATLPHANSSGFVHKPWHGIGGECVRLFLPHGHVVSNAKASQQSSMAAASGLGGVVSEDAAGDDAPLDSYARIKSSLPQGVFQEYVPIRGIPDPMRQREFMLLSNIDGEASVATAGAAMRADDGVESQPAVVYPILSVWVVDGKCAGYILRESDHPVTYNDRTVPVVVSACE